MEGGMTSSVQPPVQLREFVFAQGLAGRDDEIRWQSLAGGVSSDIWRVDVPGSTLCIKAALSKLKVAADWQAPVARNTHEWDWLCFAHARRPGLVPRPVAHDPVAGAFAMEFMSSQDYPVWKQLLLAGDIHCDSAAEVARQLAFLHASSADSAVLREQFATTDTFHVLRLDPYLLTTAQMHPVVRPQLERMVEQLTASSITLVHGDVSPKNILIGKSGPVFLDAECAWYGDPAFDAAFCLNHLLLKCLARKQDAALYLQAFEVFAQTYLRHASWEDRAGLERRIATLLPALFLARVDGKSPVEYIEAEADCDLVRSTALALLKESASTIATVSSRWGDCLGRHLESSRSNR